MYNERKNGVNGLMEALWDDAGISCEVVKSGRVRLGDSVRIAAGSLPPSPMHLLRDSQC